MNDILATIRFLSLVATSNRSLEHERIQLLDQACLEAVGKAPGAARAQVHLSPRLNQVLHGIVAGKQKKEIASDLKISENTVGNYYKQLYKRFNVHNKVEVVTLAISLRLV